MKWLLLLAPFVVGLIAASGFVALVGRLLARPEARRRRVVRWLRVGLVVAGGLVVIVGALLPRTHTATRSACYAAAPEKVWAIISDFETHHLWWPGLRAVRRLPDRNGHAVWNVVGSSQPGIPAEFEVFELELSAFIVWLHMPAGTALADAENAGKDLLGMSRPKRAGAAFALRIRWSSSTTIGPTTSWGQASSGYAPTCCLVSRWSTSWPIGSENETVAAEASWRFDHDSERSGVGRYSGADLIFPRPAGALASKQPPGGVATCDQWIPRRSRTHAA